MSGGTAGVRGTGAECRKFAPNIFNKSKCSSCFKQKEEHSAEALECNRATRKISKCGYLFVAPGWDFSNPLNRTKRWQRRWFVLYDDGELTYSVDEHVSFIKKKRKKKKHHLSLVNSRFVILDAHDQSIRRRNPFCTWQIPLTRPTTVSFSESDRSTNENVRT